ncbi:MAG: hypothetical protein LBU38_05820 [Propionibacteriaceae bacterium]|jgi:predicted  nucleic acid-binding Zn-ribbon protein|nr:hypothetical protein [Propionibacteriaceae bacterium]
MRATPEAQARLLEVQVEDSAKDRVEHRKRSLPEHAQINAGKVEWAQVNKDLVGSETLVGDTRIELEKAEADLVPVRERIARNQKRVDDGLVGAKELAPMIEEIAHLKQRILNLEDIQLEVMERLETATAELAALQKRRGELQKSIRAVMAHRDEQLAELDAELAGHSQKRDGLAAGIPADLLALYDRIRGRSGGVGAAKLEGKRCSGCQLEATAAAVTRYQSAPKDEVLRCEDCDRILVR